MNMLTHDDPTKNPNFPNLDELVTLLNGVMPYPLLNYKRGSDVSVEKDCSGIQRSNVEEGSADLNQSHIVWTDIGKRIRMLQELMNDVQDSTLGEYSNQILHIFKVITLYANFQILISPVNPII